MTKPRFVFSLLFKITLLVVAAMTAVIGIMTYDVTRAIRENAVAELTKSMETTMEQFFSQAIASGQFDDRPALQTMLMAFVQSRPRVEEIFVVGLDDILYAHNDPNKVGQPRGKGEILDLAFETGLLVSRLEEAEVSPDRTPRLTVAMPLYRQEEQIGIGVLKLSLEYDLNNIALIQRRVLLTTTLGGVGLALVVISIIYLSVVRPIQTIVRVAEKVSAGDLGQFVDLRSRDELGMLTVAFNQMVQGLRSMWERFLPPQVVERIIHNPHAALTLGGESRQVTVLFSDIRGFTSIAESLEPEILVHFLNEYFTVMTTVVYKHGGTLDKYLGDGIMVTFGAPFSQSNDALHAVRCAVEMQSAMKELMTRWQKEHGFTWHIGIGLHTGPVVAGNIGSPQRMDYTVIGDTVNTAARLEGQALPGQVLISQSTYNEVGDSLPCQALPPVKLKGKADLVGVS